MSSSHVSKNRKKVAVLLNGCGHRDGSEIHEAVLTLLAIEEEGVDWEAVALNLDQAAVLNHLDGTVDRAGSSRNMLKESARIARGKIKNLVDVNPADYVALIIPGGNGTAANLCNFATAGKDMVVNKDVSQLLRSFHESGRPIGAICISPMLIASVFGKSGVKITLGEIKGGAPEAASHMGAKVQLCGARECVVDHELKIVTTPAYMLDASVADIAQGIRQLTKDVIKLAESK